MRWVNDIGVLKRVLGRQTGVGQYRVLELDFSAGVVRVSPEPDTDQIVVTYDKLDPSELPDLSDNPDFSPLVGKVVEYAWKLTNHQGFDDAFQLRFLGLEDRVEQTRQFEAAAAMIEVRRVSEARRRLYCTRFDATSVPAK